jgi:hypothetical protein
VKVSLDSSADLRLGDLRVQTALIAVVIAAVAVFANTLGNSFALDDVVIIQQNARVHELTNQSGIWLRPYWPLYGRELGLYRPFAIFSFALQWAIGGGSPAVFHAVSIVLHAAMSVLVFSLLNVLTSSRAAALAVLLFCRASVHVEAVANTVGQAELLAGCCALGALLVAATRPAGAQVSAARLLAIGALLLIAMLTKESAIVLPALLLAVDVAQGRVRAAGAWLPTHVQS